MGWTLETMPKTWEELERYFPGVTADFFAPPLKDGEIRMMMSPRYAKQLGIV
jgi:hypothetical protein